MRKKIIFKCIQIYSLLMLTANANCQTAVLYETDGVHGKYVFSRTYQEDKILTVSEVMIADTFSLQKTGFRSQVTMSNVYLFSTTFESSFSSSTNNIKQSKMFISVLSFGLSANTRIISNHSILNSYPSSSLQTSGTNAVTYKGDTAVEQLKKMGLGLPDDYDDKKKKKIK